MPSFPLASTGPGAKGLFSPAEIRALMRAEVHRARSAGYAVTAMVVGVDRLDQLGDLYGYESRATILTELGALLRRSTRQSDWLGAASDGAQEVLFPHAGRDRAPAIARRLLERARRLVFDEGASAIQATLSIGVASGEAAAELDLDALFAAAREAYEQALESGGNRFRVHVPPVAPAAPPASVAARLDPGELAESMAVNFGELKRGLEELLSRRVRELFEEMGQSLPDFGGREQEVLELAARKLEAESQRERAEKDRQLDMLQRRLAKLSQSLEMTEGELRRVMKMKAVDPGVASIYRTVQGLDSEDADSDLKKEMMSAIFAANVELQQKYKDEASQS